MPARNHPYNGESKPRQSPPFFALPRSPHCVLSLGGCAGLGLPFGAEMTAAPRRPPAAASGRRSPA